MTYRQDRCPREDRKVASPQSGHNRREQDHLHVLSNYGRMLVVEIAAALGVRRVVMGVEGSLRFPARWTIRIMDDDKEYSAAETQASFNPAGDQPLMFRLEDASKLGVADARQNRPRDVRCARLSWRASRAAPTVRATDG